MTEQWTQPDLPFDGGLPPDRVKLAELAGSAVLVAVGGTHLAWPTKREFVDAVRCNLVVLTGPRAGEEVIDLLVFNAQPLRRLRAVPGRAFVGRIAVDEPAVLLLDPTPDDYDAARKWHANNPTRTAELVSFAVAAFNSAEANRGRQMPTVQGPATNYISREATPTMPSNPPPFSKPPADNDPPF